MHTTNSTPMINSDSFYPLWVYGCLHKSCGNADTIKVTPALLLHMFIRKSLNPGLIMFASIKIFEKIWYTDNLGHKAGHWHSTGYKERNYCNRATELQEIEN